MERGCTSCGIVGRRQQIWALSIVESTQAATTSKPRGGTKGKKCKGQCPLSVQPIEGQHMDVKKVNEEREEFSKLVSPLFMFGAYDYKEVHIDHMRLPLDGFRIWPFHKLLCENLKNFFLCILILPQLILTFMPICEKKPSS
ncbi:hypothetical protein KC19_VG295800 [Ceratodon purpureus]|uniref:Uncharacterized protein n=1 Tax=Ceratodon purpureus TaxID=3225 RepID=A0A8T0HUY4_CERPU|nr:hypothetical protein KC19_VG295800 [Ceratodon purpureus]